MIKILSTLFVIFHLLSLSYAQSTHAQDGFKKIRFALVIGHTYVPGAKASHMSINQNPALILPTWGFDLEYWFSHKFGLGLHTDLELLTYVLERDGIEREQPFIISFVGIYHFYKQFSFHFGPGYEFEENMNFWLVRAGFEYEIQFKKNWDFTPTVAYDLKDGSFNTWTIGFGLGRRF